MAFSYTLHLSNKKNAVSTIANIGRCSKHNLRKYKDEKNYNFEQIEILRGSDKNILDDVKEIYKNEFDEALEEYNGRVRSDRKIDDYLKHVSESRSDAAAEIIIQIGDREFWSDKALDNKKLMSRVFDDQIQALEKICPNFKIASAVVHYDESSPHMHIVGVPVASGYKKGMKKQVAKTKVFTKDTLSELQDKMRVYAENQMRVHELEKLFQGRKLKEKEKGRNSDIPVTSMLRFREKEREMEADLLEKEREMKEKLREKEDELMQEEIDLKVEYDEKIRQYEADVQLTKEELGELEDQVEEMKDQVEEYSEIINKKEKIDKNIAAYDYDKYAMDGGMFGKVDANKANNIIKTLCGTIKKLIVKVAQLENDKETLKKENDRMKKFDLKVDDKLEFAKWKLIKDKGLQKDLDELYKKAQHKEVELKDKNISVDD